MRIDFRKPEYSSDELQRIRLQCATRAVAACLAVAGIAVVAAASIESIDQHTLDAFASGVQHYAASEPMSLRSATVQGR